MTTATPLFEIVITNTGATSIRNNQIGETMHSPVGPWAEANSLYIDQSELRVKFLSGDSLEFVVFDVGLGAAANAVAALSCIQACIRESKSARPFRLVSFERDLELLRFAFTHRASFSHLTAFEGALAAILEKGVWREGTLIWELRTGDFLQQIEHEVQRPHIIFYDPYSPKMNHDMWTVACFKKLRATCRDSDAGGSSLYTYSLSTRIRTALIVAGFYVGHGKSTGLKIETTQAATDLQLLAKPLAADWFGRWQRSHARTSFECTPENEVVEDGIVEAYMTRTMAALANEANQPVSRSQPV